MSVHAPKLLTREEFASLIEVALSSPDANIAPTHLTKLVALGYVALTTKGLIVTGDGLIRITGSQRCLLNAASPWLSRHGIKTRTLLEFTTRPAS